MKLLIIGANGRTGKVVTQEALKRGHNVTVCDVSCNICEKSFGDQAVHILKKDLFALDKNDVSGYDVVISLYGSGLDGDAQDNERACEHYISIFKDHDTRIVHMLGSGCLFADATHTKRIYERPEHPDFLRAISMYATKGLEKFQKSEKLNWTVVMPSLLYDPEIEKTGKYKLDENLQPQYNDDNESVCSFPDMAEAIMDVAEDANYIGKAVSVLSA